MPTKYRTSKEELAALDQLFASSLRRGIHESGVSYATVAHWAGASEDSVRNWIKIDGGQRIPFSRVLLIVRRGQGPVRTNLVALIRTFIERPPVKLGD